MSPRRPGSPPEIAKLLARYGNAILTHARPLDVAQLLPSGYPLDEAGKAAAMKVAEETLDEFLSEDGVYWRGAELDYWILLPNCARAGWDLKWNGITGGLFHQLREKLDVGAVRPSGRPVHTPCLTRPQFEQVVERYRQAGGTPPVQVIDLREILFGPEGTDIKVSRRVWTLVDTLLDGYFRAGGHYTHMESDRIGLFMPSLGPSLAALKRDVIIRELHERLARRNGAAQPLAARARTPGPCAPMVPAETSSEEKAVWTQTFQAMLAALPLDASAVLGECGEADLHYDPVCRVRQGLIAGNLLRAEMVGSQATGEAETDQVRKDFIALADAVHHLRPAEGGEERRVGILIVPVSFAVLDRLSARTLYLTLCSQLEEKRRKLLVFELVSVPRDLRPMRLDERIRQLRPFCRNVVVRADLSRSDFAQFDCVTSRLVGVDLSLYRTGGKVLLEALAAFGRRAQAAGYMTYAHGVETPETAASAIESGFEFLSGRAIAARADQPWGVAPWTLPVDPLRARTGLEAGGGLSG